MPVFASQAYKAASLAGDPKAQWYYALCLMLEAGETGVTGNRTEAALWVKKAAAGLALLAEGGDPKAAYLLAHTYKAKEGEAVFRRWAPRASEGLPALAEAGDAQAQHYLATMLYHGWAGAADKRTAVRLWKRATATVPDYVEAHTSLATALLGLFEDGSADGVVPAGTRAAACDAAFHFHKAVQGLDGTLKDWCQQQLSGVLAAEGREVEQKEACLRRREQLGGWVAMADPASAEPLPLAPRADWAADSASKHCMAACGGKFSLAKRRHHCRYCGLLVCGACSKELDISHSFSTGLNACIQGMAWPSQWPS